MKDIVYSRLKEIKNINKLRSVLSRLAIKRQTGKKATNLPIQKNSLESIKNSNASAESKIAKYNKRKVTNKRVLSYHQNIHKSKIHFEGLKRFFNSCSNNNSTEKLNDEQISTNKNYLIKNKIDIQKMVVKNVLLKVKKKQGFSNAKNFLLCNTKLKLKYIQPITVELNPLKEFRFMDYVLPLDSSQIKENNQKYVSIFAGFDKIKRTVKIINDEKKELYSIYVEDRDLSSLYSTNYCNYSELSYVLDWQESLGQTKAIDYRKLLLSFMTKNALDNNCKELSEYSTKIESYDSDQNYILDKKYYIKSVDEATKTWIKSKPYFYKSKKITGNYQISKIFKVDVSYSMFNLIKIVPSDNTSNVIDILHHCTTLSFYDMLMQRLEKQNQVWNFEGVACPDAIDKNCFQVDKSGQHIRRDCVVYDEKFIKNGIIYAKTNVVLID